MFADDQLTHDAFLGGRILAWQPKTGYRAATDPVLLAAAVTARTGDTVLELGCGAGIAALCLAARVPGLQLTGVERQTDYADLARRNAGDAMRVVTADLSALPADLRQQSFDHVIANPPYYSIGAGTPADDSGREAALREETPLVDWIEAAARRLKSGGWITMINAADRLPEVLGGLHPRFGSITVRPLAPRRGRAANRVLIRARKGGRAPFVLLPPFILHAGAEHGVDGDDYSENAREILRDGTALHWS